MVHFSQQLRSACDQYLSLHLCITFECAFIGKYNVSVKVMWLLFDPITESYSMSHIILIKSLMKTHSVRVKLVHS